MCVLFFAYKSHPDYPLVVAANRDEFYERPTEKAHFWTDIPEILAGRDLEKLGTWLGITRKGRFAAITNFREIGEKRDGKKSRGHIIRDYLTSTGETESYLEQLQKTRDRFPGFNLVAGSADSLWYYSNIHNKIQELTPGIYGLSNHFLDTPWPKVTTGKQLFWKCLDKHSQVNPECFFQILKRTEKPHEDDLPNTGIGIEWEKKLSPIFIESENYGTRSSTFVSVHVDGDVQFSEKSFTNGRVEQVDFQIT